jgi:hypothetical protein
MCATLPAHLIIRPSPSKLVPLTPEALLQKLGLGQYQAKLCDYGIDTLDDVIAFSEEELVEAGMRKGHARRLRRNLPASAVQPVQKPPSARVVPQGCKTHVFLTHSWDQEDELGRNNHDTVALVNKELQKHGVVTWFDAEKMEGQITDQMCKGIDEAGVVAVFVTQRYIDKVYGQEENDNCKVGLRAIEWDSKTISPWCVCLCVLFLFLFYDYIERQRWVRAYYIGKHLFSLLFFPMAISRNMAVLPRTPPPLVLLKIEFNYAYPLNPCRSSSIMPKPASQPRAWLLCPWSLAAGIPVHGRVLLVPCSDRACTPPTLPSIWQTRRPSRRT